MLTGLPLPEEDTCPFTPGLPLTTRLELDGLLILFGGHTCSAQGSALQNQSSPFLGHCLGFWDPSRFNHTQSKPPTNYAP